jgi:hypothetical protein
VVLAVGGVGVVDLLRGEGAHDLIEQALQHRWAQLALQNRVPKWKPAVLLERLPRGLGHGLVEAGEALWGAPASREQQQREGSERECRDCGRLGTVHAHGRVVDLLGGEFPAGGGDLSGWTPQYLY